MALRARAGGRKNFIEKKINPQTDMHTRRCQIRVEFADCQN